MMSILRTTYETHLEKSFMKFSKHPLFHLLITLTLNLLMVSNVMAYSTLPGLDPLNKTLQQLLEKTVEEKGSHYKPRTKYLDLHAANLQNTDSQDSNSQIKAKYVNRLILETSPYLQQHAHNPVNWYPWGDEAFETARRLNIPVLVSIGYSTCHWCHVMEEESYDNEDTARYLNTHFIAIKVDREVRPDIDEIYMTALHLMNQRGGWPLNIWLTADKEPFYGGTYFPPTDAYNRPSFMRVLTTLSEQYQDDPKKITALAQRLTQSLRDHLEGEGQQLATQIVNSAAIKASKTWYVEHFDDDWGGLNQSIKFPSSFSNRLMMHYYRRSQDQAALDMIELTLTKMSQGGMYDQIGGGFHRYSTDTHWLIPHFEKMLYDNALLATVYIEAWQLTGNPLYETIARDTLDYILREMTLTNGGFYSATDADSLTPAGEVEEGWYFTWTLDELALILEKNEVPLAVEYFGMTEAGNFEGRNLPQRWIDSSEVADKFNLTQQQLHKKIQRIKSKLYQHRNTRPAPLRDNKILVSWNGLVISALAKAGSALDDAKYTLAATQAARFIEQNLQTKQGRLIRVYQEGQTSGAAFLEDYAFLIAGLIDLYEADFDLHWLQLAMTLQEQLQTHYSDAVNGGYFRTADDHEKLLAREKNKNDGAIPSGNSVAILNLLRLHQYSLEQRYQDFALLSLRAFTPYIEKNPTQLAEMLLALDYLDDEVKEIIIVHPTSGEKNEELERTARQTYLPNKILVINQQNSIASTAEIIPLVEGKIAIGNKSTAYVCYQRICKLPTQEVAVLRNHLAQIEPLENQTAQD